MSVHLTVCMAWHDNNWNGTICKDPEGNVYCAGTHSLLSERLARNKKTDLEKPGAALDACKDYLPPCFWSSNAFGSNSIRVTHAHPFKRHQDKVLRELLSPHSVFSWPFRLSFNHTKERQRLEGVYPKDLVPRIKNFLDKFKPGESIIFYYLNYSNPVSADDYRYALVGCSVLNNAVKMPEHFEFPSDELKELRLKHDMKNFPTLNWAIQFNVDPLRSVRLPYQEYVEHIEKNPDDEKLLDEVKVLIEERALIPNFKYVAETVDDDRCLYLLYKLRNSLSAMERHGLVSVDREIDVVEELIEQAWHARGLYPGLGNVVNLLAELGEEREYHDGQQAISLIRQHIEDERQILDFIFSLLTEDASIPDYLSKHEQIIEAARLGIRDNEGLIPALKKLSLFTLTKTQLNRILFPDIQDDQPFRGQPIKPDDLVKNPYLLCEEYEEMPVDLDDPDPTDGPIGMFTIDIGMFPDTRYLTRRSDLQNLTSSSPERIRALIFEHLALLEKQGHCFDSLDNIYQRILGHPLFYREKLNVNPEQLKSVHYLQHFRQRLDVVENENGTFFYLREVRLAEKFIQRTITKLLGRQDYSVKLDWVDDFLKSEAGILATRVPNFDKTHFMDERNRLIKGSLTNSFYVVTGKPGSGKTIALKKVIEYLREQGEEVTLLTPTGKASVRAKESTKYQAQTIDLAIFKNQFNSCLDDLRILEKRANEKPKPEIQNLIVDESSMVDLRRLAVVFGMLTLEGDGAIKPLILVGDENQLPPIGFGKPFYDIVEYLRSNKKTREKNIVRLETNCRQKFDEDVIRIADVFAGTNRYYAEMLAKLQKGYEVSPGLYVVFWKDKDELQAAIKARLTEVLKEEAITSGDISERFNLLMGLFKNGYLQGNDPSNLQLDRFQIITPYNAGFYGSIGINDFMRSEYKQDFWPDQTLNSRFGHSDKIIRTQNWYWWEGSPPKRVLALSNGSIGVVCNNKQGRHLYFPDRDNGIPSWKVDDEENFELAYAITIHKSQGSEFKHTFIVLPERKGLLYREMVYTALTRSSHKVTLFVRKTDDPEGPLGYARKRSAILARNSSLFQEPMDAKRIMEPEAGVLVKSKIEYIIYRALMEYRNKGLLSFDYEKEMSLTQLSYPIKTDFCVYVGDRTYYWEHLGMLDLREYSNNWKDRKHAYEAEGFLNSLVTTDDLSGISQEIIQKVVDDMINGDLQGVKDFRLSDHHYRLYHD